MTRTRMRAAAQLLIAAAVGATAHGCTKRAPVGHDPEGARGVYVVYRELAQLPLWPGFAPARTPLAVFDGSSTWLFAHPAPPADFDSIAPGVRRRAGRAAEVTANSSVPLAGVVTATLKLARPPAPDSTARIAATAIHEAFHVFERDRHPGWVANEVTLFTYPCESESLAALANLEMDAWARAVSAEDRAAAAGWTQVALEQRRARFARLDAEQIAYERHGELNEGLAQYVENRALRLRGRQPANATRRQATELGAPAILARPDFAPDGIRWRVYVTGEALAVLLDRFAPGWADSIEVGDGRALDVRLGAALPQVAAQSALAFGASEVTAAHAAATAAVAELRAARSRARRDFDAAPGERLRFAVERGEPLWPQGFDPLNVTPLENGAVLHTRWLRLGNSAGSIEVLDCSALTMAAGTHPLFEGVRALEVTGLASPIEITHAGDTLVVRARGVAARLQGAQSARDGAWTDIRLGKGAP